MCMLIIWSADVGLQNNIGQKIYVLKIWSVYTTIFLFHDSIEWKDFPCMAKITTELDHLCEFRKTKSNLVSWSVSQFIDRNLRMMFKCCEPFIDITMLRLKLYTSYYMKCKLVTPILVAFKC